jgi:small GTP-binding protein
VSALNETPKANRIHIAFFGLRNAGKSTLVNALTGQEVAIVSDVPGTTTDPVSKAMEIQPLGPCLITDTAGLDDTGALGEERVRRTLDVLATTDVAVWVSAGGDDEPPALRALTAACAARKVPLVHYRRGETVAALKARLAALSPVETAPGLLEGLVEPNGRIVCVCPIDSAAPKGRLILPQVQLLREALDRRAVCTVCQPEELPTALAAAGERPLVVTDSQAFGAVRRLLAGRPVRLTSFSILFARQKGDLGAYRAGLAALPALSDGDRILVAEGCTHHRQCDDIGTVKIPQALRRLTGRQLQFSFASGSAFDLSPTAEGPVRLVVQCGGCMLTRREMLCRIERCRAAGVPVVNYGLLLAAANGLTDFSPDGLVAI